MNFGSEVNFGKGEMDLSKMILSDDSFDVFFEFSI